MKAGRLIRYGGKEAVRVIDVPVPQVTEGKILIQVYAAGLNPIDWKIQNGFVKDYMPLELPVTLGGDFAGVVAEVGAKVSEFKVGDEVYGQASVLGGSSGSFAQFLLGSPRSVALKPKSLNFLDSAVLPLAGVSALQALTEHINLSRGQKILIHGGAGGIGSMAIQIAKHLGAVVATTVSANDIDFVKSLGVDQVIDHRNQKFEEIASNLDAVFDTVGGEVTNRSVAVLKKGGILVSMVGPADEQLALARQIKVIVQMTKVTGEALDKLSALVQSGVVKVHVDKVFPLEQLADALYFLQHTPPQGKVVLEVKT